MPSSPSRAPSYSASESSSSSQPDDLDVEPTSELKHHIKGKIEVSMSFMMQDADNIRAAQQRKASLSLLDPEKPTLEYQQTVARIKELAEERYHLELKIARERIKLRVKLAQVMESSLSRHSSPSTTPPSRSSDAAEFEPDDEWKEQLKKKIKGELTSMVQAAKDTQMEELKRGPITSSDREFLELEYQKAMKSILTIADEQYVAELNRERNQRRCAPMDPSWVTWVRVLHEEQEDILASIKRPRHSKFQSPAGRFATEIIPEDNQDGPNGRYKPTPSPLSKKQKKVRFLEEEKPKSREDSEEENSDDSDAWEELIGGSPVTSPTISNGVRKPTPQYNSASIREKDSNNMPAWRTKAQAAQPSTKPAQVPTRPPSTEPVRSRFGIPIPPNRTRLRDDLQNGQWRLNHMIHENLRSRRYAINSASTASSRPSPMISGASNPFTPEIH